MSTIRENVTFYFSAVLYFVFNMRPVENDLVGTLKATGWQLLQTAPYVAGGTFFIIALLQYMADGHKVPWDRRLRLFFAIGIMAALVQAIYEYAGQGPGLQ